MGLIDRVEEEVSPLEWARSRLRRLFMLT
jgi:hypothetical protein